MKTSRLVFMKQLINSPICRHLKRLNREILLSCFYSHGKIYGGQIRNASDFGPFQEILFSITVFFSLRLIIAIGAFNSKWDQASSRGQWRGLWIFLYMNSIFHPFRIDPSQQIKASLKGRHRRTSLGHLWSFPPLYSPTLYGACGTHCSKNIL
jgi:hypothetical protein